MNRRPVLDRIGDVGGDPHLALDPEQVSLAIQNRSRLSVGLVNLGCARNQVDGEVMLGALKQRGYELAASPEDSDVVVVNTCAFIQEAKQESIDTILELAALKQQGKITALLVAGCLAQRYGKELEPLLPEVDGFLGTGHVEEIVEAVDRLAQGRRFFRVDANLNYLYTHQTPRVLTTPRHFAYVKVSEGCSHTCSFCVIPAMRGPHRSRPMESIEEEIRRLVDLGVKEVILIGQDTSSYGFDLYGEIRLGELLRRAAAVPGVQWLRLLYTYPSRLTLEHLKVIAQTPNICKYVDLPLQHINDRLLRVMKRGTSATQIRRLLDDIRRMIPGVAIRTAFIAGFPGETEEEFEELVAFVRDQRFERLGVFTYSHEEGSASYDLRPLVPKRIQQARHRRLMEVQQEIARSLAASFLGRELEVLVDEPDPSDPAVALGRTQYDAPEVDGQVFVKTNGHGPVQPGALIPVRIVDTYEYDLVAVPINQ